MAESATSVGSLTFLGLFAMCSLSPRFTYYASSLYASRKFPCANAPAGSTPCHPARHQSPVVPPACPLDPETSYWLGDANEMAAINTILIIVNSPTSQPLSVHKNF